MKTYTLPQSETPVSSIVVGLMRIAALSDREIDKLFRTSLEVGVTMFDHADVYGSTPHECESRFGAAVKLSAAERDGIILQSKAGIGKGYFDFSKRHILEAVDGSLAALKTDYLDALLLHRPDTLVEPDEVAAAFDALHAAGKVRRFGVSNQTPGQIELLKSAVRQPLIFNQVQFSVTHANLVAQGIAVNMNGLDQSIVRDVGLLDYSRLNGIMLQAWSPFQKGFFNGSFVGDRKDYRQLNELLDEQAARYGVTPTGIATAWITRHPANIQVVLGTTRPDRVREAAAGSDVHLTRPEWYALFRAAGHTLP
jgi:predicted oxidoreductase